MAAVTNAEAQKRQNGNSQGKQLTPFDSLHKQIQEMQGQFKMALPDHVTVQRFTRCLLTAVREEPKLMQCDRQSLFGAAMEAAQLGLLVGKVMGHAYIIPYNVSKKGTDGQWRKTLVAQLIPGYRGYIAQARNSGEVQSISAYEVCENDLFNYELGLEPRLTHKPARGDRGNITDFYCAVRFKDGGFHIEVMTVADVERVRSFSRSKDSPAWKDHYMMMGRKTAIRRASRYLPLSVQRLAAIDNALDAGQRYRIDGGEVVIEGESQPVLDDGQRIEHRTADQQLEGFTGGDDPQIIDDDGVVVDEDPSDQVDENGGDAEEVVHIDAEEEAADDAAPEQAEPRQGPEREQDAAAPPAEKKKKAPPKGKQTGPAPAQHPDQVLIDWALRELSSQKTPEALQKRMNELQDNELDGCSDRVERAVLGFYNTELGRLRADDERLV